MKYLQKKFNYPILLFILSAFFVNAEAKTYSTKETWDHVGEWATVCGTVSGKYFAKKSNGQPTFINLDGVFPNHLFTIVIWKEDREKFDILKQNLRGREICVTGEIESFKEKPQMTLRDPKMVAVKR
jgi:hypothetical protein